MRPGVVCKLRFEGGSILPGRGPWNLRMIGPRGPIILVLLDPGSRSGGVQSYCDTGMLCGIFSYAIMRILAKSHN